MKKIIITEDDNGVVEIEQFYKDPNADKDWRKLETSNEIDHFGGVVGFHRLFHQAMRQTKMNHMKAKRKKGDTS